MPLSAEDFERFCASCGLQVTEYAPDERYGFKAQYFKAVKP